MSAATGNRRTNEWRPGNGAGYSTGSPRRSAGTSIFAGISLRPHDTETHACVVFAEHYPHPHRIGGRAGNRTQTTVSGQRVLSPQRLPISPPGHFPYLSSDLDNPGSRRWLLSPVRLPVPPPRPECSQPCLVVARRVGFFRTRSARAPLTRSSSNSSVTSSSTSSLLNVPSVSARWKNTSRRSNT